MVFWKAYLNFFQTITTFLRLNIPYIMYYIILFMNEFSRNRVLAKELIKKLIDRE